MEIDWTSTRTLEYVHRWIEENRRVFRKRSSFRFGILSIQVPEKIFVGRDGSSSSGSINKVAILLKEPPRDNRDSFLNELRIGLQLNRLRNQIPNFVYTYGKVSGQSSDRVHEYIILEHIPGITLSRYQGSFRRLLGYCIQVIFALEIAYSELGFTHYNAHRRNVVLKKLSSRKLVRYGDITIETDRIPILIDFGRSYTTVTGGHSLPSRSVYPVPNHFHDVLYFLTSALRRRFPRQLETILSWYGVPMTIDPCSIVNHLQPRNLTGKDLLFKFESTFGYVPVKNWKLPILVPE